MIKNFTMKMLGVGVAAVLGTVAATGTASATDWVRPLQAADGTWLGYAYSYGTHGAVGVCDSYADGHGVAVQYKRVYSSGPATVMDANGSDPDTCVVSSHDDTNPIAQIQLCLGAPSNGICNGWIDVPTD